MDRFKISRFVRDGNTAGKQVTSCCVKLLLYKHNRLMLVKLAKAEINIRRKLLKSKVLDMSSSSSLLSFKTASVTRLFMSLSSRQFSLIFNTFKEVGRAYTLSTSLNLQCLWISIERIVTLGCCRRSKRLGSFKIFGDISKCPVS